MSKMRPRSIVSLVAVFTLCTCIDPYTPKLIGYESLLVVDGLITDANSSNTVRLTRTFKYQNSNPLPVSDAAVSITDDAGNSNNLINKGNGIYKTDSTVFKGVAGKTYSLHILTKDGNEYESDPSTMKTVPDIDSLYFEKDQKFVNNGVDSQDGISIYLDSKAGNPDQYFRWVYEETWKFKVPVPKRFNYINDSTIVPVAKVNEYCWKNRKSDEILINSNFSGQNGPVKKEPILFIGTNQSDRLLIQYSVKINQYSISKSEFEFWNNMKQINESGGDIFAKQPFSVISNIHNKINSDEQVLGYFQISAVKTRRKNISFSEVGSLNLPFYHYPCTRIEMAPSDYPRSRYSPPLTFDELNDMFLASGYYFCEPIYIPGTFKLQKLVFALPECADCEITGTSIKPDFWIDL
jgi:hypothetical protein